MSGGVEKCVGVRGLRGTVRKSLPPQSPFSRASIQSFKLLKYLYLLSFLLCLNSLSLEVEEKQNTAPKLGQPSMFWNTKSGL